METKNWIGMSPILPVVFVGMNPPALSKSVFYHLMQNINESWGGSMMQISLACAGLETFKVDPTPAGAGAQDTSRSLSAPLKN